MASPKGSEMPGSGSLTAKRVDVGMSSAPSTAALGFWHPPGTPMGAERLRPSPDRLQRISRSLSGCESLEDSFQTRAIAALGRELRLTDLDRYWSKVTKDGPLPAIGTLAEGSSPCWGWSGFINRPGYGMLGFARRSIGAHRVSYLIHVADLLPGLEVDHLCVNPVCSNPEHLEQVGPSVNNIRSQSPTAVNARATHCKHGHPFDEANTVVRADGKRSCRECLRRVGRLWARQNRKSRGE